MPAQKHLILIHGRSTKPSQAAKTEMVTRALKHGLDRVDPSGEASQSLDNGTIKYDFVYYGDIANQRMLEKNKSLKKQLTATDPDHHCPCEPTEKYTQPLDKLLEQKLHTKAAYKEFLKAEKDYRWMDNAAAAVSWIANLTGFSDEVISRATADMGSYLMERKTGSAIRQRLQGPLREALLNEHDICLVAHSMGCIVSYDVLWKFSQMSEYRDVQDSKNRIKLWLTLGNPLGEPGVRKNLYDSNERADGLFPKEIIDRWINIAARDDFVSHDADIADDFAEMKKMKYLREIKDLDEVYTFWVNEQGTNPHKFYGYLDNPTVAKQILNWMQS